MKQTTYLESTVYPRYTVLYHYSGVVVLGKNLSKDIYEVQKYNCIFIDNVKWIRGLNRVRIWFAKVWLYINNL